MMAKLNIYYVTVKAKMLEIFGYVSITSDVDKIIGI